MNASELRLKARESLVGSYWPAVLAAFVAAFFGALVTTAGSFELSVDEETLRFLYEDVPAVAVILLAALGSVVGTLNFVCLILGGVIQLGYAQYLLKQQDREIHNIKDLFSQFDRFAQGFLQMLLRNLFTALWSLLFIIPGIIKSLSYSMTPFLMADNPDLTAREAIKLSMQLMEGHKWELFCLGFSFIGWNLLSALTLGIGSIFLNPYTNAAYAAFYRDKIAPKAASATYFYADPPVLE